MGLFAKSKKDKTDELQASGASATQPRTSQKPSPSKAAAGVSGLPFEYSFEVLGISGTGFLQAAKALPEAVACILDASREIVEHAGEAKGNRHNCLVLSSFLKAIVGCLDQHGKLFAKLPLHKANELASLFNIASAIVAKSRAEGWLVHMAFAVGSGPEVFSETHNSILELVQGCLPAHATMHLLGRGGDYRDVQKDFKQLLKHVGSGTVVAGISYIQNHKGALEEAAKLLGVEPQALISEIAACDLESAAFSTEASEGLLVSSRAPQSPSKRQQAAAEEALDPAMGSSSQEGPAPGAAAPAAAAAAAKLGSLNLSPAASGTATPTAATVAAAAAKLAVMAAQEQQRQIREEVHLSPSPLAPERSLPSNNSMGTCSATEPHSPAESEAPHSSEAGGGIGPQLKRVFQAYATFGERSTGASNGPAEMDGARFAKLCRETGLLNKTLNNTRVDLIFTKVCSKGQRRIGQRQFAASLELLAEARGCDVTEIKQIIVACEGPQRKGTVAGFCKFHDDKSTYTGVYARGGPSTGPEYLTLESLTSRAKPAPSPNTHSKRGSSQA